MKRGSLNISATMGYLVSMISLGVILWQRSWGNSAFNSGSRSFNSDAVGYSGLQPLDYGIQFPGLTPLLVGAAMTYHSSNPVLGLVASWPLWMTSSVSAEALPALIEFNNTIPSNLGFIVQGGAANDNAGYSVAGAGDVNGDGKADFIVGARQASPGGRSQAGAAYLIFGANNLPATINLGSLGTAGVILQGGAANDNAGYSVAGAGDINGDGKTDFIVGANGASPGGRIGAGAAYLIYGANNLPATIDLGSLGTAGVTLQGGAANDRAGFSVASAGDVNGDRITDFIVGANGADPGGRGRTGAAYLIYGANNLPATINLGSLGTAGVTLQGGAVGDGAGVSVASAGDINGDGKTDFIVGANGVSPGGGLSTQVGAAYLIYGANNLPATINLGNLGTAGVTLQGNGAAGAGNSVASAGDVNGDGKTDIIVGALLADPGGRAQAGAAYLIYGADNLPATINLGSLGVAGVTLQGGKVSDYAGVSVVSAGDVNSDGKADFIVGAKNASPGGRSQAGAAYLIFGANNLPATVDLGSLGTAGVTLQGGAASDYAGWSVASAGDLNGDGKAAFIVGAYQANPGGRSNAGAAYVIYGSRPTTTSTIKPTTSTTTAASTPVPTTTTRTTTLAPTPMLTTTEQTPLSTSTSVTEIVSTTEPMTTTSSLSTLDVTLNRETTLTLAADTANATSTIIGAAVGAGIAGVLLTTAGFFAVNRCRKNKTEDKPMDMMNEVKNGVKVNGDDQGNISRAYVSARDSQDANISRPYLNANPYNSNAANQNNQQMTQGTSKYSNSLPPVQPPYAGFKFGGADELDKMNREVDEHHAKQQQGMDKPQGNSYY